MLLGSAFASQQAQAASSNTDIQLKAAGHVNLLAVNLAQRKIGLIAATTTALQLKSQIESTDGSQQAYAVQTATGTTRADGSAVAFGDVLIVTAADGVSKTTYRTATLATVSNSYIEPRSSGSSNLVAVYNKGLTITAYKGTTVANLLDQVESSDGTAQTYAVTDAAGAAKSAGALAAGDKLVVTSQDGTASFTFTILLVDFVRELDTASTAFGQYTLSQGLTTSVFSAGAGVNNFAQNSASNGTHLQVAFTAIGQWIEMTANVPAAGEYEVNLGFKKNNGRGNPQLSIDGVNQGPLVDEYIVTTDAGMYMANLGKVQLSAGNHTLRFTLMGRTAGTSYTVSLDFLGFTLQSAAPIIVSVTPADVATVAGTAPVLPSKATAVYSDGSSQQADVAWESISPAQYAAAGSFTVYGAVAGTTIKAAANVTVTSAPKTAALLSGTGSVNAGDTFELTYGLSNLKEDIYSQDITLTYDPSKVEFISATSLNSTANAIYTKASGANTVRILMASLGENNAVKTGGNLLSVKWQVKPLTGSAQTAIALSNVIIANAAGEETALDSVSHNLSITYTPTVDKTALNAAIASAQSTYDGAAEGNQPGQYPAGSKAALQTAIHNAMAAADSASASQQQIDQAKADLDAAVHTFLASVITRIPGDVSGDGKVSVADLAIVAKYYGKSNTDADWNTCKFADLNGDGKIDIEDLAIIAKLMLNFE
ncbi:cohesin domain-containing protein [Paenibacillus planticolens]|nr:cohesin domain-containing protein [Paenibacillus planticolens]